MTRFHGWIAAAVLFAVSALIAAADDCTSQALALDQLGNISDIAVRFNSVDQIAAQKPKKRKSKSKSNKKTTLTPFAKKFKRIIDDLLKVLSKNSVALAKDFFKYYKPRMAANADVIKQSVGVHGNLSALVPLIVQHETAIWQHSSDYLQQIEVFVVPLLHLIGESLAERLTDAQRREPRVCDALRLYDEVGPAAGAGYQAHLEVCRSRYSDELDQQLTGLVRLQQQVGESPGGDRDGGRQREFEALYDRKQAALMEIMQQYWRKVQSLYDRFLESIKKATGVLFTVIG